MTSRNEIRTALAHVPAHDRDVWLRMGMAVKSELGEDGFDLWDEWSQRDDSYCEPDARAVWRSIGASGKVTLGTLYHEAKRHGYRPNGNAHPALDSDEDRARREAQRREADARDDREREQAATLARSIIKASGPAGADHPYLTRKSVAPAETLRELDAGTVGRIAGYSIKSADVPLMGRLLIAPIRQGTALSSLEFIDEQGSKAALKGRGSKSGGFWSAQRLPEGDGDGLVLYLAEGVATALSIREATGAPTFAALSCGNMAKAANALKARYPRARIVICGDLGNGEEATQNAARAVGGLVALPDFGAARPDGASDFNDLAQHGGVEAVRKALQRVAAPEAPEQSPGAQNAAAGDLTLRALTLAELLCREFPLREPILSPWLVTQSISMVYAWRGVGKTHLALAIAYAVASGGAFLTWQAPRARRVLYVDGEMPAPAIQARLRAMVETDERDFDPANLLILTPDAQAGPMPDLATRDGQDAVDALVAAKGVELVIVDNISTLCRDTGPENEAGSWRAPQEWALRQRRAGRSVLFVHHSGKSGAQRGSSKREDTLDVSIALKRPADYRPDEGARFEIHFEKYRNGAGEEAKPVEARLETDGASRAVWTWRSVDDSTFDRVVALATEGLRPGDIAAELGINKSNVSRHLKRARAEGLLAKGGT